MEIEFTIFGVPQPQGSMRAFIPKSWHRPIITSDNPRLRPFRQELAQTAMVSMRECGAQKAARGIPIAVALTFVFEKPKSERKAALHKTTKPDLDKLLRAVLDALTGIAYEDDAQVCECRVAMAFGSPARLEANVSTLAEGVPKTPKIERPQLFDNAHAVGGEIGVPKTHDFGRAR